MIETAAEDFSLAAAGRDGVAGRPLPTAGARNVAPAGIALRAGPEDDVVRRQPVAGEMHRRYGIGRAAIGGLRAAAVPDEPGHCIGARAAAAAAAKFRAALCFDVKSKRTQPDLREHAT